MRNPVNSREDMMVRRNFCVMNNDVFHVVNNYILKRFYAFMKYCCKFSLINRKINRKNSQKYGNFAYK